MDRSLVKLEVSDLIKEDRVWERVSVIQSKTKRNVQFELTENTRDTVLVWVKSPKINAGRFMFPSRFHDRPHVSTRQHGRIVRDWVTAIGLEPRGYGTHSLRRTKAAEIHRKTGNLRAVQLLLGNTKVDSTVRFLGVEIEDALSIAERIDICPKWASGSFARHFKEEFQNLMRRGPFFLEKFAQDRPDKSKQDGRF